MSTTIVAELWTSLSSYIQSKDRLAAAEALIRVCDEHGFTEVEFDELTEDSKVLETAYHRHFADLVEDYGDDE